jgi:ABC-2 type transport system permease protein
VKFWEIVRFELALRLRRPATYAALGVIFVLAFNAIESVMLEEARGSGNINANAPYLVAGSMIFVLLVGLVIVTALFGDTAARDAQNGTEALFFTAPLGKFEYLGGRFVGTLAVNVILFAVVPLTLASAGLLFDEPRLFGEFRVATYLQPFLLLVVPTIFAVGALTYVPAVLLRRSIAAFAVGLILFLGSLVSVEIFSQRSTSQAVAAFLDPFGYSAIRSVMLYWTPAERNVLQIAPEGFVLWNRLGWLGAAGVFLGFMGFRFRFAQEGEREVRRRRRHLVVGDAGEGVRPHAVLVPRANRSTSARARLRQTLAVAGRATSDVILSRYSLVALAIALSFVFIHGMEGGYVLDTPTWPVTYYVVAEVIGMVTPVVYLLIAFYAGVILWRERDAGQGDLADVVPVPNWVVISGKYLALAGGVVVLQLAFLLAGIAVQLSAGFTTIDLPLYLGALFGVQLVDYLLWAALAFFLQVVSGHKYAGYALFVLYFAFSLYAKWQLGLDHNLLLYPAAPEWEHSDFSGFEPFLGPYFLFKLYWGGWAALFLVAATLLWQRGRREGFSGRVRALRESFGIPALVTMMFGAALVAGLGAFIYYNTNVLNEYRTAEERDSRLAEMERRYKRYEALPRPDIAAATLRVELYPEQRAAEASGVYTLVNRGVLPIDAIHVMERERDVELRRLDFDRPARETLNDSRFGYRIFTFDRPLRPGQKTQMRFAVEMRGRGFRNQGLRSDIVSNGSYFDHDLLPSIGYSSDREIEGDIARREQGLRPKTFISVRDPRAAEARPRNAEWFHADVVIGTAAGQIAVAPGKLARKWNERGRSYFHYRTDAPIRNVYGFMSADYAVREEQWRDVKIELLHHPAHTWNVERIMRGAKEALQYCSDEFGPYLFDQIRIAEVPRHAGRFARAFPGLVAFSEGFGFIARPDEGIDYPMAVAAHEVAHQWWGGALQPADTEGRRVLTETLAHYTALMVLERTHGPAEVGRFLDLMTHRYLVGRQNRGRDEVPLLYSREHHKFIHYDKGAVVMYTLRHYLGEEGVNLALRRLFEKHRLKRDSFPTSLDLLAELRAVTPPPMQYLLKDLLEDITVWQFRMSGLTVEPAGERKYRVTVGVESQKLKADGKGRDAEVAMNDLVEIALFDSSDDSPQAKPFHVGRHWLRSGQQTVTMVVGQRPARATVDPNHRLIERQRRDNSATLEK